MNGSRTTATTPSSCSPSARSGCGRSWATRSCSRESDDELMPIHLRAQPGDYAEACLLPGDLLRAKHIAETYLTDPKQVNGERGLLGFTGTYEGTRVSVQGTGMGSPGATI